jgi:hypothetical protein
LEATSKGYFSEMKSEVIRIRLDSSLLDTLRKQGQQNERSIAKEIQFILKQSTQQGGANK